LLQVFKRSGPVFYGTVSGTWDAFSALRDGDTLHGHGGLIDFFDLYLKNAVAYFRAHFIFVDIGGKLQNFPERTETSLDAMKISAVYA